MDGPAAFDDVDEHRVSLDLPPSDRFADAQNVLNDHAPRADIEVPDLGVSHLTRGQADGLAGSIECRPSRLAEQPVEARLLSRGDRVPSALFAAAETVQNDQDERRAFHGGGRRYQN